MPRKSTLTLGLSILAFVSSRDETTIQEIAERFDLPDSTAYRYLQQLVDGGYLYRAFGLYYPGRSYIAWREWEHPRVKALLHQALRGLATQTRMISFVSTRIGRFQFCIDVGPRVGGARLEQMSLKPGAVRPLYAGSSADLLLAFAPEEVIHSVTNGRLRKFTGDTPSGQELARRLTEIRRTRLAVTHGELTAGTLSIAAPVVSGRGVVYALSVASARPAAETGYDSWLTNVSDSLRAMCEKVQAVLVEDSASSAGI